MDDYWARKAKRTEALTQKSKSVWFVKFADPLALMTAVLALFTAVLAILAFLQWRTLEKTDETQWASNRAWLSIRPTVHDPIDITTSGRDAQRVKDLIIPTDFVIENTGNMPGTDVRIFGVAIASKGKTGAGSERAFSPKIDEALDKEQAGNCPTSDPKRDWPLAKHGPAIFPKQSMTLNYRFSSYVLDADSHAFVLTGCVVYKMSTRTARTGFRFYIEKGGTEPKFDLAAPDTISPVESVGHIPVDQIRIETDQLGNFAD